MEGDLIEIEVIVDAIEEGTGCSVEFGRRGFEVVSGGSRRELFLESLEDGFLGGVLLSNLSSALHGIKGIVIVAIPINIVRVDLLSAFIILDLEEPASSGIGIRLTGTLIDGDDFRIDEFTVDHEFESTALEGIETHHSVTDDN